MSAKGTTSECAYIIWELLAGAMLFCYNRHFFPILQTDVALENLKQRFDICTGGQSYRVLYLRSQYGVFNLLNTAYSFLDPIRKEKTVNARHKEVLKASTSKGAESLTSDADHGNSDNGSSSSSKDLNFRGFMDEETKVLSSMISRQLEEFKKEGIMKDFMNEMATYRDFTACDVPKFDGTLDLIASTRWLSAVKGAFRTSCCKEKNKVNFASNFLRDSAKMWWDGTVCEKGGEWIGSCLWKDFKELFNVEYVPAEEVDKIREEFQTLMQTNEMVNELWKNFNDLIPYCPEYHGNEKLKVERFQRMLRVNIREVISPFKCTTLDDLLSRARAAAMVETMGFTAVAVLCSQMGYEKDTAPL
ncbi:zinc finger, CCHC-type, retrotransposon gag domain protein [Tanacetum coccineum]